MNLRNYKTVKERRDAVETETGVSLKNTGVFSLDEAQASSRNCENMIGVTQVPLGIAGPLRIQNSEFRILNYFVPLATTEGALVASISRGCKAITESGGAWVRSQRVGATRGPVFQTSGIIQNEVFTRWLYAHEAQLAALAASTSSHLKLTKFKSTSVGRQVFVRFSFDTQDAMGMNMVTVATTKMVEFIEAETGVNCLSVAGNFDIDKKPAWLNIIDERGIKAWAEVTILESVVQNVLKTTSQALYDVWLAKCMVGSAISGSMGFNAHMANVLAAVFLATGQDLGHVGEGSCGITTTEVVNSNRQKAIRTKSSGKDLYVSVYLPDLMLGTVGGGTSLATQQEALQLLGVSGGNQGKNAEHLAEIIAAVVLAGEISLLASLSEGSLARAHERLARGKQ